MLFTGKETGPDKVQLKSPGQRECLSWGFYCAIKQHKQINSRRKGCAQFTFPPHGSLVRRWGASEQELQAEAMEKLWYQLSPHDLFSLLSYTAQDSFPGREPPMATWVLHIDH